MKYQSLKCRVLWPTKSREVTLSPLPSNWEPLCFVAFVSKTKVVNSNVPHSVILFLKCIDNICSSSNFFFHSIKQTRSWLRTLCERIRCEFAHFNSPAAIMVRSRSFKVLQTMIRTNFLETLIMYHISGLITRSFFFQKLSSCMTLLRSRFIDLLSFAKKSCKNFLFQLLDRLLFLCSQSVIFMFFFLFLYELLVSN